MAPTIATYKAAEYFLLSAIPDSCTIAGLSDALADIEATRGHGNLDSREGLPLPQGAAKTP